MHIPKFPLMAAGGERSRDWRGHPGKAVAAGHRACIKGDPCLLQRPGHRLCPAWPQLVLQTGAMGIRPLSTPLF